MDRIIDELKNNVIVDTKEMRYLFYGLFLLYSIISVLIIIWVLKIADNTQILFAQIWVIVTVLMFVSLIKDWAIRKLEKERNVVSQWESLLLYVFEHNWEFKQQDIIDYFKMQKIFLEKDIFMNMKSKTTKWISPLRIVNKWEWKRDWIFNNYSTEFWDIWPLIKENQDKKIILRVRNGFEKTWVNIKREIKIFLFFVN